MQDDDLDAIAELLNHDEQRGPFKAATLLPLMYDALRRLASSQLRDESPETQQSLHPTALVHEAFLRLVERTGKSPDWNSRGHFYGAAAIAMRRILVERARSRLSQKRGGGAHRMPFDEETLEDEPGPVDMLALDDALLKLEAKNEEWARIVVLRFFAGLSIQETAAALGVGATSVKEDWAYARAWLRRELSHTGGDSQHDN